MIRFGLILALVFSASGCEFDNRKTIDYYEDECLYVDELGTFVAPCEEGIPTVDQVRHTYNLIA
jgi:hypothetical protein